LRETKVDSFAGVCKQEMVCNNRWVVAVCR
jgi:hypothetical protein